MEGRADNIKGYNIAIEVFGRFEDFNTSIDPIASVRANRLRQALERYYLLDGKSDPIVTVIPKGTYVPSFFHRQSSSQISSETNRQIQKTGRETWPILKIVPFKNTTGDPEKDYIGTGISAELTVAISQLNNFRVCYALKDIEHTTSSVFPRFILEGEIYQENETVKLLTYLIDTKTNTRIRTPLRPLVHLVTLYARTW